MDRFSFVRTPQVPAVPRAEFDRQAVARPFRDAAAVNKKFLVRNPDIPEQNSRCFTVIAIAAIAIDHDLFRRLANWKNSSKVFVRMIRIKFAGTGNVSLPVVQLVTGINEYNNILFEARVAKKICRLTAVNQLQSVFLYLCSEKLSGRKCGGIFICHSHYRAAVSHRKIVSREHQPLR